MNNSGPTAQIVDREGWKTSLDFVGHRKAITVVVMLVFYYLVPNLLTSLSSGRGIKSTNKFILISLL